MPNIQEVFNRLNETKKEQRVIKTAYRDALGNSHKYQEVLGKLSALKEEKKKIEEVIRDEFRSEFDKLDHLKQEIENDKLILSDLAINQIVKGEMIEITDDKMNKYEPIFSVRFKKA